MATTTLEAAFERITVNDENDEPHKPSLYLKPKVLTTLKNIEKK